MRLVVLVGVIIVVWVGFDGDQELERFADIVGVDFTWVWRAGVARCVGPDHCLVLVCCDQTAGPGLPWRRGTDSSVLSALDTLAAALEADFEIEPMIDDALSDVQRRAAVVGDRLTEEQNLIDRTSTWPVKVCCREAP
jgi:hypothetical protein